MSLASGLRGGGEGGRGGNGGGGGGGGLGLGNQQGSQTSEQAHPPITHFSIKQNGEKPELTKQKSKPESRQTIMSGKHLHASSCGAEAH